MQNKADKIENEANVGSDLPFKRIEFPNEEIETQINRLLKIIYCMIYKGNAPVHEIVKHLITAGVEIAMRSSPKPYITVKAGDIAARDGKLCWNRTFT